MADCRGDIRYVLEQCAGQDEIHRCIWHGEIRRNVRDPRFGYVFVQGEFLWRDVDGDEFYTPAWLDGARVNTPAATA
jgi:hypothetical protein